MKAKVYSAEVNGTFTQIKAYKKVNAIARFKQLDETIKASDVKVTKFSKFTSGNR
jgi:hypothetical protein